MDLYEVCKPVGGPDGHGYEDDGREFPNERWQLVDNFGLSLRTGWSLWQETPLRHDAAKLYRIAHPDDFSSLIIHWSRAMVTDEPFFPQLHCVQYHEHWASLGMTSLEAAGWNMSEAKKGYSIWSLLVIMTLLAVWLAVPRRIGEATEPPIYLCFVIVHQLVFWTTIATSLWMVTGKRKAVRYVVTASILLFVSPLLLLLIETTIYKNRGYQLFSAVLTSLACQDPYVWTMTEIFGYDF